MIDYKKYMDNEDFLEMLDYVRGNCLIDVDQLINELDIDSDFIIEHFNLVQAIVSKEIENGELNDAYGFDIVYGYMEYLEEN